MCQRLNTGESNNFYFDIHIFICIGPLWNKVQPTTVMKLLWDFAYVPKGSYR